MPKLKPHPPIDDRYPGKPGRKPTGRSKPLTINCLVNSDEDEYIARKSYSLDLSKSRYILMSACGEGWMAELSKLRSQQKSVPEMFRRS